MKSGWQAQAMQWNDGVEQQVRREDYVADATAYAVSYCRDFRALHQLSHDHDCRSTCVKYVKPKVKAAAEERVKRGLVVACRFSSIISSSLRAALYSLPSVKERRLSSAFAGKGRNSSTQLTSLGPMTATNSVRW